MIDFENIEVFRLELRSSLFYVEDTALPFASGDAPPAGAGPEMIFCFEIDEASGKAIDPDPAGYLGPPVFSGRADAAGRSGGRGLELPAGAYFFAQAREALSREACVLLAVEVQREILWQRLRPEKRLYIRRLFEEGKPVTQAFRTFGP
jgi:hypothetical protein